MDLKNLLELGQQVLSQAHVRAPEALSIVDIQHDKQRMLDGVRNRMGESAGLGELEDMIEETHGRKVDEAQSAASRASAGLVRQTIYVVHNRANGAAYLPVAHDMEMSPGERLLFEHVTSGLDSIETRGNHFGFVAYTGEADRSRSHILDLACVNVMHLDAEFPDSTPLEAPQEMLIDIKPRSYVEYNIVPCRKRDKAHLFFPNSKEPFMMATPYGWIKAHVTSERADGKTGNYIDCPRGTDNRFIIADLYSAWGITTQDSLKFREILPGELYKVDKVI
jgi:hypothetical protein